MPVSSSEPAGRGNGDLLAGSQSPRDCETRIAAGQENPPPYRWSPLVLGRPREHPPCPSCSGSWGRWVLADLGDFISRSLRVGRELAAVFGITWRWRRRETAMREAPAPGIASRGGNSGEPACPADNAHGRIVRSCRNKKGMPELFPTALAGRGGAGAVPCPLNTQNAADKAPVGAYQGGFAGGGTCSLRAWFCFYSLAAKRPLVGKKTLRRRKGKKKI